MLADLDNTLVPYKVLEPSPEVAAWMAALKEEGIDLFLLSNSRKPGRAQKFAQQVGIPYQGHSGKPKKAGYLRPWSAWAVPPRRPLWWAIRSSPTPWGPTGRGSAPLLIKPIRLAGNPGRYVRYAAETPFRLLGGRRPFL